MIQSANEKGVFGSLRVFDKRIFIFQNGVAAVLHLLHFEMKETHFKVIEKTFKPIQTANHHRVYFIHLIGKYSKQK